MPGLGLAPLPEEDHVVTGQHRVLELGQHRVVEAEHPGHQRPPGGDAGRRVAPDLLGHRDRPPARVPQAAEGGDVGGRGQPGREVERGLGGVRVGGRLGVAAHGREPTRLIRRRCGGGSDCTSWSRACALLVEGVRSHCHPARSASRAGRDRPAGRAVSGERRSFTTVRRDGKMMVRQQPGRAGRRARSPDPPDASDPPRPNDRPAPGYRQRTAEHTADTEPATRTRRQRLDHAGGGHRHPGRAGRGPGRPRQSPPSAATGTGSSRSSP